MGRRKPIRQINLRITEQLRQQLEAAAAERRVSINQLMRQLLEDGLVNEHKAKQSLDGRVRRLEDMLKAVSERLGPSVVGGAGLDETESKAESSQQEQEKGGNK